MISIGEKVVKVLKDVGVTVHRGAWKPDATHPTPPATYIVFTFMTKAIKHADDVVCALEHHVYFELWASGDYTTVLMAMRTLLWADGFEMDDEREHYETSTKMYDLSCDWSYMEDLV